MIILDLLHYSFWQRALVAVCCLGLIYGVWGGMVVAKRMAFFSDAISHAALTGIAIGLLVGWNPVGLAMVVGVIVALLTIFIKNRTKLNFDTVLGLFLPLAMALGVIILSFKSGYVPDLMSYLFGNILAVSWSDLWLQLVIGVVSLVWLIFNYRKMVLLSFDRGLAQAAGIEVEKEEYILAVLLSLVVVAGIKAVGIILVGALLVIPAMAARNLAVNFKQMLVFSGLIGVLSGIIGLVLAAWLDWPSGASIVVTAAVIFFLSLLKLKK